MLVHLIAVKEPSFNSQMLQHPFIFYLFYLFIYLYIYLFIYLFMYLFVYVLILPSICLFIHSFHSFIH